MRFPAADASSPGPPTPAVGVSRLNVLVVIPTLDEERHILGLLEAVLKERSTFATLRVVVADGGSRDRTVALADGFRARHPEVVTMLNPARIQSAAVNAAVRGFGQGVDVLIRCDAHAAYPPRYCARLAEALLRTGADALVVPLDSKGTRTCWQKAVAEVSNSPLGTGGSAHRGGRKSGFVDHGHHAAFRMETFLRAGGYDESFTHNEDAELDCRQRALGARIYLDSEIRVGYEPRASARALWRQYFAYGQGRSRTVRRHPRSARLRQLAVPAHLVLSVAALGLAPRLPLTLLWPASYVAVLAAASIHFAARRRDPCYLWSGAAAGMMHLAWASGFLIGALRAREPAWSPRGIVPLVPARDAAEGR